VHIPFTLHVIFGGQGVVFPVGAIRTAAELASAVCSSADAGPACTRCEGWGLVGFESVADDDQCKRDERLPLMDAAPPAGSFPFPFWGGGRGAAV
jgi:hypothetical protein